MIWWAGGGNFTHHQDTNRLIKAWQKPDDHRPVSAML